MSAFAISAHCIGFGRNHSFRLSGDGFEILTVKANLAYP